MPGRRRKVLLWLTASLPLVVAAPAACSRPAARAPVAQERLATADTSSADPSDAGAEPDTDGDGVPDRDDRCPSEPEVYNGFEDEDGCPDMGHPHPPAELRILLHVDFAPGSAKLSAEGRDVIEKVAATMAHHPDIVLIEGAGLADPKEANPLALSQKRADAVVAALVAKGIGKDRLRAAGYGALCPDLALGPAEQANRIVRFAIVQTTTGPGTEPIGCVAARTLGNDAGS